jgi:ABC-type dipeptide/oligopeptide/nickel transport system ATPase subunit
MNSFSVAIHSIQHIKSFRLEIDLHQPKLMCLVGRNGVGKTTLMRALRNLSNGDTFLKTANPQIFAADSRIEYRLDDVRIEFHYDPDIRSLNCKKEIPRDVREAVSAELPMPHGARFNYFRSASDADIEIRRALIIQNYTRPEELIGFLSSIYATDKYNNLVEVSVGGRAYYSILLEDDRYIREDYLSSGEYFLINLYRTIKSATRLVAVDEIDLSLDAAAQAQLATWLRTFCEKYECTILFTTHSLAIMRTLDQSELAYVEQVDGNTIHYPASYSYVKARLFGFVGWDKYILTEDLALKEFIEYVIQHYCPRTFFTFKVIHIGGASQVTDLLRRNETEKFLSDPSNVKAILDGDQQGEPHAQHRDVHFVPIDSVEKAIFTHYNDADFPFKLPRPKVFTGEKDAFNSIRQQRVATTDDLHGYICTKYDMPVRAFAQTLGAFLGER